MIAVLPVVAETRSSMQTKIKRRLDESGKTISEAIAERKLYFRISLVSHCNLACPFCHNEGAPLRGRLDLAFATEAIKAAAGVGFTRVQFTGGEPLLHPQVAEFVGSARSIVADVGITTNGTFLEKHLDSLVQNRLTRLHISLQVEPLEMAGKNGVWGVPEWLISALDLAAKRAFLLRLNLPVPSNSLPKAKGFLEELAPYGCDIKTFSILPEGATRNGLYPLEELIEIVEVENRRRSEAGQIGTVQLRGYRPPTGIRCRTCPDQSRCKEQSHSLRLGADRMLRPCLATRAWDSVLEGSFEPQIRNATLLALDYRW